MWIYPDFFDNIQNSLYVKIRAIFHIHGYGYFHYSNKATWSLKNDCHMIIIIKGQLDLLYRIILMQMAQVQLESGWFNLC